jgi:hypothetical protein
MEKKSSASYVEKNCEGEMRTKEEQKNEERFGTKSDSGC